MQLHTCTLYFIASEALYPKPTRIASSYNPILIYVSYSNKCEKYVMLIVADVNVITHVLS